MTSCGEHWSGTDFAPIRRVWFRPVCAVGLFGLLWSCASYHDVTDVTEEAACVALEREYYDEALLANQQYRPVYKQLQDRTGVDILNIPGETTATLEHYPMGDQYQLSSVPLLIGEEEYGLIQRGVAQRARAYAAFLWHLISGDEIPHSVVPYTVVQYWVETNHLGLWALKRHWRHKLKEGDPQSLKDHISFFYGPDLMRGANGEWWVLEDNIGGDLGGPDDISSMFLTWKATLGLTDEQLSSYQTGLGTVGRFTEMFATKHRIEKSQIRALAYKQTFGAGTKAIPWSPGIDGLIPANVLPAALDLGQQRLIREYENIGISVSPIEEIDHTLSTLTAQNILAFANARWKVTDEAWSQPDIWWMQSPDTEMLGNKVLLPYVEAMIDHYLGEKPLLRTRPSAVVIAYRSLQDPFFELVPMQGTKATIDLTDIDNLVLKAVDQSGGTGVGVGRYVNLEQWLVNGGFTARTIPLIAQQYLEASRLLGYAIDIRPLCYVAGFDHVTLSPAPWGRRSRLPATHRVREGYVGLTNTRQGAFELVVLVVKSM